MMVIIIWKENILEVVKLSGKYIVCVERIRDGGALFAKVLQGDVNAGVKEYVRSGVFQRGSRARRIRILSLVPSRVH